MTISTTTIKNSFAGNNSTSAFNYTFKIAAASEMQVIIRSSSGTETIKTLTTHYTISGRKFWWRSVNLHSNIQHLERLLF